MFTRGTLGERDWFSWSCVSAAISQAHVAVLLPVTLTCSFPNASFSPASQCYLSVGVAGLIEARLLPFSLQQGLGVGGAKPGNHSNLSWRRRDGGIHTEPAPPST